MAQTEYIGAGALARLSEIIAEHNAQKIFLVVGKSSYQASGAEAVLAPILASLAVTRFDELGALTLEEHVTEGLSVYKKCAPDLVVAVGGGHVLDAAKAINAMGNRVPLVAVPTTGGSGAEATPFAVIYKAGVKTSLDGPEVLPTYAIIDPLLIASTPRTAAIASGLDALCQALESLWAKGATNESRGYATEALELVVPTLKTAVDTRDPAALDSLARGAHCAGKAIAISKTTAAHALSYGLTYRFGIPHGIAAALLMPPLMRINKVMLPVSAEDIESLLRHCDVGPLSRFGVKRSDAASLSDGVDPERLGNNPRALSKEDIQQLYMNIL
ncbi:phosphonoacetaldehyde reductase [Candidatus Nomurabacteria bacterium]|nr:phosphonoacetaldehyde reductase [Candidatus Nomurabacteria bacterium]